jgi:outer membrane protein
MTGACQGDKNKETNMELSHLLPALPLAASLMASPALAQDQGALTIGLGVATVVPKDDNGTLAGSNATIGNSTRPSITVEYFVRNNLGVEVLAALPFKHGVSLDGTYVGETKQLPPTVTLNWHFPTTGALKPFIGAGVNYTKFFEEKSALGTLKAKESFGLAAHLGADWQLDDKRAVRFDLRYIDIDSKVYLDGDYIGTAKVDPLVAGVSYVMKF